MVYKLVNGLVAHDFILSAKIYLHMDGVLGMINKIFKIQKKNKIEKINNIKYERVNFFNYFKNNGYVKKILTMYEDESPADAVFYNDRRAKTEIPCIDKEIFMNSKRTPVTSVVG